VAVAVWDTWWLLQSAWGQCMTPEPSQGSSATVSPLNHSPSYWCSRTRWWRAAAMLGCTETQSFVPSRSSPDATYSLSSLSCNPEDNPVSHFSDISPQFHTFCFWRFQVFLTVQVFFTFTFFVTVLHFLSYTCVCNCRCANYSKDHANSKMSYLYSLCTAFLT